VLGKEFQTGDKMSLRNCVCAAIVGIGFALFSFSVLGQGLPPGLTPGMLNQLKAMPPAQQQALARQYGISLSDMAQRTDSGSKLAEPGQPLRSPNDEQYLEDYSYIPDDIEPEEGEDERVRFGASLFDSEVSTFAPTDNAPVPDGYRLGVGDELVVQLYGKENEQLFLEVGRTGEVSFPRLGAITLSGLSFEDARDLVKTRIAQQLIGVDAVVTMGRLRAISIFMAGEISVPGTYSVSAMTTVTQALFQAGGVTDIGSLRQIEVRRADKVGAVFDAYDLLMKGDASGDIRLLSGDVVYVPTFGGEVHVLGEVKRPMVYELTGDETVADAISMAGSFSRSAFPASTLLTRKSGDLGLPSASTLDLSTPSGLSFLVRDGDVIEVPGMGELVSNSVVLRGAVARPGDYGWVPGMRVSNLISNARRDLAKDADLGLGMIVRQKNAILDIEVLSFDLASVIASPGSREDPLLNEFDEVLIFSLVTADLIEEADVEVEVEVEVEGARAVLLEPVVVKLQSQARQNEPVQLVSVSGAVRAPGTYPLIAGATVGTLISAAGGLTDSAYLKAAELRRLANRTDGEVRADYIDVDLSVSGGQDLTLASRDHLTVRDIPDWSPRDSIVVEGEVKFPGEYRIRKGETLSDVIARAGGFTDEASPGSAIFTREAVAALENQRAAEFARDIETTFATRLLTEETTTQAIADVAQIVESLQAIEGGGRLLIDLPAAMSGDANANLEVTDGDLLVIPKLSNTVSVVGEVKRAGTHTFQSELSLDDYVDLSAGFTRRADDGGVYIVKANGSVVTLEKNLWRFTGNNSSLDPGDTIVVPIDTQYKESLASWREITQIVYQSMVSIAAVANL
jgi:polysaccharide export outer membrane protein